MKKEKQDYIRLSLFLDQDMVDKVEAFNQRMKLSSDVAAIRLLTVLGLENKKNIAFYIPKNRPIKVVVPMQRELKARIDAFHQTLNGYSVQEVYYNLILHGLRIVGEKW